MASSKEDGTAAAAEQLRSISLGSSAERKNDDNETEPTAKNGTPTKVCSACGKKSNTVKKCTGCLCVWYCDKKCQNKHRKEHKRECRPIKKVLDQREGKLDLGEELDVEPLGEVPLREECPICMRVLPIHPNLQGYSNCCGKTICSACGLQHQRKSRSQRAEGGQTPVRPTCAFCREPNADSDEKIVVRQRKRVELLDPTALCNMAFDYGYGAHGLPVDQAKCINLLRQSADLGNPDAHYSLGNFYCNGEMGIEQNKEEAVKSYQKAAEGGNIHARHNLGWAEDANGDYVSAIRHFRLSASGGLQGSMLALIIFFENGSLHHSDLAEAAQAFYVARDEMKSEDRDKFIQYLKFNGEYKEEYDM